MQRKEFIPGFTGEIPGGLFFAAYLGPSMNPTLREPEILEIIPCTDEPLRVGDVIFFRSPEIKLQLVHRILSITPAGITTRGDNNTRDDPYLLQPGDISGRVVAAWRGQKRRRIAGGLAGRAAGCWRRCRFMLDRKFSPLLQPLYHCLSHGRVLDRLLPWQLRPRIVMFQKQGRDHFQLVWRKRIIGQYNDQLHQWQIQRPFRLLVDGKTLSGRPDKHCSNEDVMTKGKIP